MARSEEPDSYLIEFMAEDGLDPMVVTKDTLVNYQLAQGKILADSEVRDLLFQDEVQKAFNKAAVYLAGAMRTIKQVRQHLRDKGYDPSVVSAAVEKLIQKGYLDDRQFARSFIQTELKTTNHGPLQIQRLLRSKGVEEEIIEEAFRDFPADEEISRAVHLAMKWVEKKPGFSVGQIKADLQSMLLRKGYTNEAIRVAVEESLKNLDDNHDEKAIQIIGEKALKKYVSYPPEEQRNRVKSYLLRKGFSATLINEFLKE
jgi:RecX family.